VNVIREHPRDPNVLFVGTDHGVYYSRDGGKRWNVMGGNLPSAQVSDLQVHGRDNIVVISTYGRGMWAFDLERLR
jgi:ligand-binding sensor domain-containing protein